MENENIVKPLACLAFNGLVLGAGLILSNFAFSYSSKQIIVNRDRICQDSSGTQHMGMLEASHFDHDQTNPNYDDPDNGRLLYTQHHLTEHRANGGHNGLSGSQNKWAITQIRNRLLGYIEDNQEV